VELSAFRLAPFSAFEFFLGGWEFKDFSCSLGKRHHRHVISLHPHPTFSKPHCAQELVGDQVSRTNHETWLSSKLPGLGLPFAHCVQIGGVNAPLSRFQSQTRVYVTTHQQTPLRSAVQQEVSDTLRGAQPSTPSALTACSKDLVEKIPVVKVR
jgi:hypothetical protein